MTSKNKVQVIITGGTIDAYYDGKIDTVVTKKKSVVPAFIKSLKLYSIFQFTQICMKDSRNLTKADLKKIFKSVSTSTCKNVLITHGTYTMPDTARYLKVNLKRKDQVIILTGAMIPLDGFPLSDAGFNLGYSISQFNQLRPGVYVCMNGKIFTADEASKQITQGRFISLFSGKN